MLRINKTATLTLFRMGLFRAAHGWGTKRTLYLKSVTHIPQWWNLAQLPKKIEKLYELCDTPVEFCWHQHFIFATTNRIKGIWVCVHKYNLSQVTCNTAWKESVFGVILVHIFPHLDQSNSEYGHFLRSIGE